MEQHGDSSEKPKRSVSSWIIMILAALFMLPFLAMAALILLIGAICVVCVIGCIAMAIILSTLVLLICGVIIFGAGIYYLFVSAAVGAVLMGGGCIALALGMLFTIISVLLCVKMIPALIRVIGNAFDALGRLLKRGRDRT